MEYTPTSRTACYKTSDQVLCVNFEVLKQLKPRRVSYTNFNRSCFLHQNSRLTCIFVEFDYCILVIFIYSLIVIILVKFNAHSLVMSPLEAIASKHCPHYIVTFSDYRKHISMHRRNYWSLALISCFSLKMLLNIIVSQRSILFS